MSGHGDIAKAPFTPEQVESLNDYQKSGAMHPFTCGYCRDRLGIHFVRAEDGSLQPFDHDTDPEWQALRSSLAVAEIDPNHPLLQRLVLLERELVATEAGWVCRTCSYVQDWAWAWMADRSWEQFDWRRHR